MKRAAIQATVTVAIVVAVVVGWFGVVWIVGAALSMLGVPTWGAALVCAIAGVWVAAFALSWLGSR